MNDDGYEICKKCKGKKEIIICFEYKGKKFHYYEKCGHCFATGKIDWVEKARGRKAGWFINPAGCVIMDGTNNQIYDGHDYIKVNTERGKALWHELRKRKKDEEENEQ